VTYKIATSVLRAGWVAVKRGLQERAAEAASKAPGAGRAAAEALGEASWKSNRARDSFKNLHRRRDIADLYDPAAKAVAGTAAGLYAAHKALKWNKARKEENKLAAVASDWEFNETNRRDVRRQVHVDRAESKARVDVAGRRGRNRGALAGAAIGSYLGARRAPAGFRGRMAGIGALGGALVGAATGRLAGRASKNIQLNREADQESRKFKQPMQGS